MGYVLTEEQQLLKDSAKDLFKAAPVSLVRDLRDGDDEQGFSSELWTSMVEMGWPGLAVSEDLGGLDFGIRGLGVLMEESGRSLSASPLLSVVVGTQILEKYGSDSQKAALADICDSGKVIALAIQEGSFYKDDAQAVKVESGKLSGTKDLILDAHVADMLIVSAQTEVGVSIFLIDNNAAGVTIEKEFMMDSRYYSKVHFDNVAVSSDQALGAAGKGKKIIGDITNLSSALIAAELVGLMSEAFERTVAYLKERKQFGVAIGSFQGLQHRAADMYGEIELAKSLTYKALIALEEDDFMAPALCSMAKAKCSKVSQTVTNEGVQMYGGIGMTDDEEIGFFMKRARVAAQLFGSYSYHLDRFASMSGY